MIESHLLEAIALPTTRRRTLHLDYRVRVGERITLTTALPHRLHQGGGPGVTVEAFYFDLTDAFPVLVARLSAAPDSAVQSAADLALWTEQTIDRLCAEIRWDRNPLVHQECSDAWEKTLIRVDVGAGSPWADWVDGCAEHLGVPFETVQAFTRAVLALGEEHRLHTIPALPLVIAGWLDRGPHRGALPEGQIFTHVDETSERELLRAKVRQLRATGELIEDRAALDQTAASVAARLDAALGPCLDPADPAGALRTMRVLLNLLGFSAKEQDYLILLGSSLHQIR